MKCLVALTIARAAVADSMTTYLFDTKLKAIEMQKFDVNVYLCLWKDLFMIACFGAFKG